MTVLGIESSCDETAVSIVVNGHQVLTNIISSQVKLHSNYGGVVPELAAREHLQNINKVCQQAFQQSKLTIKDIDGIAVTSNPGFIASSSCWFFFCSRSCCTLSVTSRSY